jgi:glycerophosphoryl diester phosphodiesterase
VPFSPSPAQAPSTPHPKATTIPPIIGFAHRGAPTTRSEANTLPAFTRALALGATGLEADIALTADGVPVLTHIGIPLRRGPRPSDLSRTQLPPHVPSLQDLYERCGTDFDLSLDMAQPRAAEAVVQVAGQFGALDRLWLTYWRLPELRAWRQRWSDVHLVYPSLPLRFSSAASLVDRLAAEGVDVLNLHHRFCRARLVEYAHQKEVRVFAWGIRSAGPLGRVMQLPIDGVYCDNVESMADAIRSADTPTPKA